MKFLFAQVLATAEIKEVPKYLRTGTMSSRCYSFGTFTVRAGRTASEGTVRVAPHHALLVG